MLHYDKKFSANKKSIVYTYANFFPYFQMTKKWFA